MRLNIFYPISAALITSLGIGVTNLIISSQSNDTSQSFQSNNNELKTSVTDLNVALKESQDYVKELSGVNNEISAIIPELDAKLMENRDKLLYPYDFTQAAVEYMSNNAVYYTNYKPIKSFDKPFFMRASTIPVEPISSYDQIKLTANEDFAYIPIRFGIDSANNGQQLGLKSDNWNDAIFSSGSNDRLSRTFEQVLITHEQGEQIIFNAAKEILKNTSELAQNFIRNHFVQRIKFRFKVDPSLTSPFGINNMWVSRAKEDKALLQLFTYLSNINPDADGKTDINNVQSSLRHLRETDLNVLSVGNSHITNQKWFQSSGFHQILLGNFNYDLVSNPGFERQLLNGYTTDKNYLSIDYWNQYDDPHNLSRKYQSSTNSMHHKHIRVDLQSLLKARLNIGNTITYNKFNRNQEALSEYGIGVKNNEILTMVKNSKYPTWTGSFYRVEKASGSIPRWTTVNGYPRTKYSTYNPFADFSKLTKNIIRNRDSSTIYTTNHNTALWINNDSGAMIVSYVLPLNRNTPNFVVSDFEVSFVERKNWESTLKISGTRDNHIFLR